jgi:hypothetical protein
VQLYEHVLLGRRNVVHQTLVNANNRSLVESRKRIIECAGSRHAQSMAAHESPRTTKLYDRTQERLTQDEVERIRL